MLNAIKYIIIISGFIYLVSCAAWVERKPPAEIIEPALKWDLKSYAEFASQNIQDMDAKYTKEYVPYEFVVDMDSGSTRIQNLIDPQLAASINMELGFTNPEVAEQYIHAASICDQ